MTDDRDEFDPSDWLTSQFGDDPLTAPTPTPAKPIVPPAQPLVQQQPAAPVEPAAPVVPAAPLPQQPVFSPTQTPPQVVPAAPFAPPPLAPQYEAPAPQVPPAPQVAPAPQVPSAGGGAPFQWGLTPGGETPAAPEPVSAPEPAPFVPPVAEPAPYTPPAPEPAPYLPPVAEPAPYVPPAETAAPFTPPPIVPAPPVFTEQPLYPPTTAYVPPPVYEATPTTAYEAPVESPTTAYPQQQLEPIPFDSTAWLAAPVDASLEGVTEVLEAELVGNPVPEGEGLEPSALDSLFGDQQFTDYAGQSMIQVPPPRLPGGKDKKPREPGGPIPRNQKILMWVAGGLVAALALVALFLVGTRLSAALGPSPALATSPSPSPSASGLPLGPVSPGEYQWDSLLGGECIDPFESAWQDKYVVVDCAKPHAAQMVHRGEFPEAVPPDEVYPGLEELQKRINLLCTAPTIIDYALAGAAKDIEVTASFAVDADDWDDGNREFFCFVSRTSGEDFTTSIAMPQVAPTPTPLPTP